MKGLLKKDFYYILQSKALFLIMLIAGIASMFLTYKNPNFSAGFVNGYIVVVCSLLTANSIAYDQENNGMIYLMSLAISRKTYINSKYVLALLTSFFGGVLVTLIFIALSFISGKGPYPIISDSPITMSQYILQLVLVHIGFTSLALIFNSISIPSLLKYDSKKGIWVALVGFLVVAAVILLAVKIVIISSFNLEILIGSSNKRDIIYLASICALVSAIIMLISYGLSQKIMRAKEF